MESPYYDSSPELMKATELAGIKAWEEISFIEMMGRYWDVEYEKQVKPLRDKAIQNWASAFAQTIKQ